MPRLLARQLAEQKPIARLNWAWQIRAVEFFRLHVEIVVLKALLACRHAWGHFCGNDPASAERPAVAELRARRDGNQAIHERNRGWSSRLVQDRGSLEIGFAFLRLVSPGRNHGIRLCHGCYLRRLPLLVNPNADEIAQDESKKDREPKAKPAWFHWGISFVSKGSERDILPLNFHVPSVRIVTCFGNETPVPQACF